MPRRIAACLPLALALVALVAGCRNEPAQSELDRFVAKYRELPREEAIDSLRTVADSPAPTATYARYELGNVFYSIAEDTAAARGWNDAEAKANLDSAEAWFLKAVAADSTFVEGWVNLGAVWDSRADMMAPRSERELREQNAEKMYERALEIAPGDEKARCNLGALYLRQRKTMEAKEQFTTVLDQDPESALAHYHLAVMFAEARIYREAEREWKLAAKYDSDGNIGERSRENIKILEDLQEAQVPENQ